MSLTHSLHRQKRAKFDNYFSCRITFVNSEPKLKYLFTSTKVTIYGYLGLQLSQPKRRKKYRPCYWELLETGTQKNENRVKSGERQKKARKNTRNHSGGYHTTLVVLIFSKRS